MKSQNKTVNMEIYISACYSEQDHEFHYMVDSYDTTQYSKERVAIGTQEIEIVVPCYDTILPKYVNGLKEMQSDIRAEMHQKIEQIQDQINKVLALEYIPSSSQAVESTGENLSIDNYPF